MISDDLPSDAFVDEELAALIPFARAVWAALPLPSRTVGSPDMDARAFLETAESQLFSTCHWLNAKGGRPDGIPRLSDNSVRSKEDQEPGTGDPHADLMRELFFWQEFRNMLGRFGMDPPEAPPPTGAGLGAMGAHGRELERAVPGMRQAMLDAIDLLPTAEQRSAIRAALKIR
jgi:hypothetical protein